MEYKIISSYTLSTLEDMVTARLKDGWQCQGGITVVRISSVAYFQAMINTAAAL